MDREIFLESNLDGVNIIIVVVVVVTRTCGGGVIIYWSDLQLAAAVSDRCVYGIWREPENYTV